jgi:hypothetical protein
MAKCTICGATFTVATAPCGHPFRPVGAVKLVKRKPKAKPRKKR